MTSKIETPTPAQAKEIETAFLKSFGVTYNKMQKKQLALMVANQSMNYKKMEEQARKIAQIGITMQRQRNWFHKLCRKKDGLD